MGHHPFEERLAQFLRTGGVGPKRGFEALRAGQLVIHEPRQHIRYLAVAELMRFRLQRDEFGRCGAHLRGFVLRQPSIEVRAEPMLTAPISGHLPYETEVFIVCTTIGDVVEGPGAGGGPSISTPVRTALDGADIGFVPDAWVKTGTAAPQAGTC